MSNNKFLVGLERIENFCSTQFPGATSDHRATEMFSLMMFVADEVGNMHFSNSNAFFYPYLKMIIPIHTQRLK